MPLLDVSDAFDYTFLDTIAVFRRLETVSSKGRDTTTDTAYWNVNAVVCPASGSDLERLPDYEVSKKYISVVTNFRLQMDSTGPNGTKYKPDIVKWADDHFIVETLDDASRYGLGFVEAICSSTDYQDPPPTPEIPYV